MELVKIYSVTLVSFLALDSIWLGLIAPKFYKKHIGFLMTQHPNFFAALVFYLIFILGLVVFVIQPALNTESSWTTVLVKGALFGLVTYATFDLTNQAVIKNWPWLVTGVDLVWGTFITSMVSLTAFVVLQKFFL